MAVTQKKDLHAKETSPQQRNSYGVVVLLLVGIVGLGSYLLLDSNPNIFDDIFSKSQNVQPEKEQVMDEGPGYEVKNQEEIVKFAPDEVEEEFPADDSAALSPYDKSAEDEKVVLDKVMPEESPVNNINDYRVYLANAHELFMKFSKDIDYSENLSVLRQFNLPKDIQEIVMMFEEYNNLIQAQNADNEKVSFFNSDIFDRFLKIRKETLPQREMKKLKMKIESKSELFSEYIFSAQMQEEFLK